MLEKYAVRFIHMGQSRTYILMDIGKFDAICTALDLLETDVPEAANSSGLALIVKAWPEGAHLADEGEGPVIDTTRPGAPALRRPIIADAATAAGTGDSEPAERIAA